MGGVVHMLQPRQVSLYDILSGWKLEQTLSSSGTMREQQCVATIELRRDGTVVTRFNGKELVSDYVFKKHSWPR
jgi:hypothetical protein